MASTYLNSFDLLGDDESEDVTVLYDCMKKKKDVLHQVPSSPTKTRKEYIVFVEEAEPLIYEEDENDDEQNGSNENGKLAENGATNDKDDDKNDGWQAVPKKTYVNPQAQRNGFQQQRIYRSSSQNYVGQRKGRGNYRAVEHAHANGNANENSKGGDVTQVNGTSMNVTDGGDNNRRRGRGRGRGRGNGGYRARGGEGRGRGGVHVESPRIDNGGAKESDINGDVAAVGPSQPNSQGDSGITFGSLNGEKKKTIEEVKNGGDDVVVPVPEETLEQRKEREVMERRKKDWEERRRKWEEEQAEEAKLMTLDQYEKEISKKKQALNLQKEEARRVVAADKDLENMTLVGKKQEKEDDVLIVETDRPKGKAVLDKPRKSEETPNKSDSFRKEAPNPMAVSVAGIFRRASYGGTRGQSGNGQGRFPRSYRSKDGRAGGKGDAEIPTQKDFPVLGSVTPKPAAPISSSPAPSEPNKSAPLSHQSSSRARQAKTAGHRASAPADGCGSSNNTVTDDRASIAPRY